MANALVAEVLKQLMSFLQELKEEAELVAGAREEVKKLSVTFKKIHAVLDDAEKQQITNESVKHWIGELKDVAYDIDDVLDEWRTRILKSQVNEVDIGKKKVSLHRDIGHRIKKLRERLDVIASEKDKYDFKLSNETEVPEARLGTSSVIISKICGRDLERDTIVSMLVSEGNHHNISVPVVSIVGMGGLGKTTLAQLVFNADKVISHFERTVWVCVSDPFDVIKLAKIIAKKFGENVSDDIGWDDLLHLLCKSIKGKLFLLVLDDVWTEDHEKWNPLMAALNGGARGCRIVVTTRSERVALMMGSTHIHNLGLLSENDSWSLFSGIAFAGREKEERDKLEKIGIKITKKCGGLPLALKSVGSLMLFKKTSQQWNDVLRSHMWEFTEVEQGVLPALLLSYFALPSHLKRCFTYCAIFPKDMVIQRDMLIKLWMSQGYITSKGRRELESIGEEYFDTLTMRSFFQDFEKDSDGIIFKCKMHDLLHDLAQILTQNECLFMENNEFKGSKVRHLTAPEFRDANSICSANNIRTLGTTENSILRLFHQLTCLRVLSLLSSTIIILPPEVEKLIHLRYLNLSGNGLIELPETITNLYNLETLMLNDCRRLCELPQGMGKLVNLRHLGIECTDKLEFLPRGIGRMRSLRTLSKFIVGGGCKIEELKNLNLLQRKLEIKRLERVTNKDEAMQAELKNKQYLRDLRLFFEWNDSLETNEVDRIEGVLEGLEPQANLNELTIRSYIGCKFPRWMMSGTVMSNLRILIVDQCNCVQLPFLESLERLEIWRMPKVKRIESEILGIDSSDGVERSFPKLEILRFDTMDNLEEWDLNMKDIMPRLKHLTVRNCPKLKRIPAIGNLEVLETLEINGISSFEYVSGELWGLSNREDGGESAPAVVFPKLKKLQFKYMDKWEEWEIMTRNEITIMPCLLELDFFNCSKLKSVPECIMSSGTIRDLTITNCPFLMWTQSCLPPLLERLSLTNDAGDLLKEIPACSTLKRLDIAMAECVSLPQGLAHLKSLQRLFIFECKKVKCIPQELQHLTSLQELEIIDCDILGPRCQKEVGEDWNIISHIPNIQVDAHLLLI